MTARSARARRWPHGSVPGTSHGAHGVFLAALPFAVIGGVALVDVLAGPGVGFLPVLSLGPALAAISRRPLPTALIGALALACGALSCTMTVSCAPTSPGSTCGTGAAA